MEPSGTLAWVTNLYDDTVTVLDLRQDVAVATVPVGDMPNGISYSSRRVTAGTRRQPWRSRFPIMPTVTKMGTRTRTRKRATSD
jgi:YVTN family beta-propeller protein